MCLLIPSHSTEGDFFSEGVLLLRIKVKGVGSRWLSKEIYFYIGFVVACVILPIETLVSKFVYEKTFMCIIRSCHNSFFV